MELQYALRPWSLWNCFPTCTADKGCGPLSAVPWLVRDIGGRSCAMPKWTDGSLIGSSQSLMAMPSHVLRTVHPLLRLSLQVYTKYIRVCTLVQYSTHAVVLPFLR
jgi:hypothetical protein